MNEEREKLVDPYAMTVANLRRRSNAVYLACEAPVAEDISKALRWAADEIERLSEAHAEIQRLQDAKRRALSLADERAKENVALRAALAATASEGVREALDKANYKMGWWLSGALDDPQVCAEMKADINAWFEAYQPGVKITSAAPDTPDEGPDPLGYAKGEKA